MITSLTKWKPERAWLASALRIGLALFFALSATYKLSEPGMLARAIAQIPVFPDLPSSFRSLLAGAVMGGEFFICVSLFLNRWTRTALTLACILPLIFAIVVAPFYEALGGDCGCVWGWVPLAPEAGWQLVIRNTLIASAALLAYQLRHSPESKQAPLLKAKPWKILASLSVLALALTWAVHVIDPTIGKPCQDPAQEETAKQVKSDSIGGDITLPGASAAGVTNEHSAMRTEVESLKRWGTVRVVDERGASVGGALIYESSSLISATLTSIGLSVDPPAVAVAETDAGGMATLPTRVTGQRVAVQSPGMEPLLVDLRFLPANRTIKLTTAEGPRLVCTDLQGLPLISARILIEMASWGWPISASRGGYFDLGNTGDLGDISLPKPTQNALVLLVLADGMAPWRIEIPSGQAHRDVIETIPFAGEIAGHIAGGNRAEKLSVLVIPDKPINMLPSLIEVADDGSFVVPGMAIGELWHLTACTGRNTPLVQASPTVAVTAPSAFVTINLAEGTNVSVLATSAKTGEALPPRLLSSILPQEVLADEETPHVIRVADGECVWPSVGSGQGTEHSLWVISEGFAPAYVGRHHFRSGESLRLGHVELEPLARRRFRVLEKGSQRPVPEARVHFVPDLSSSSTPWADWALTTEEGVATLAIPSAALGRIAIRKSGWVPYDGGLFPEPAGGESIIYLARAAQLTVNTLSSAGRPIPQVAAAWRLADHDNWQTEYSTREGTLVFEVPPGDIVIGHARAAMTGEREGVEFDLGNGSAPDPDSEILVRALQPGEERSVTLSLAYRHHLEVDVLVDGIPLEGLRIIAIRGAPLDPTAMDLWSCLRAPRGITDSLGVCRLEGLPLGAYTFVITDASGAAVWTRSREVEGENTQILFRLASRAISVRVFSAEGTPVEGARVRVRPTPFDGLRLPRVIARSPLGAFLPERQTRAGMVLSTNSDGSVRFRVLSAESSLIVECIEPEIGRTIPPQEVPASVALASVELHAGSAACIEVLLVDESGAAQSMIPIRIAPLLLPGVRPVIKLSDSAGLVTLSGLAPGGWLIDGPTLKSPMEFEIGAGESRSFTMLVIE